MPDRPSKLMVGGSRRAKPGIGTTSKFGVDIIDGELLIRILLNLVDLHIVLPAVVLLPFESIARFAIIFCSRVFEYTNFIRFQDDSSADARDREGGGFFAIRL